MNKDKLKVLHFIRTYGIHGGEKQLIKIVSHLDNDFKSFFLDISQDLKFNSIKNDNFNYNFLTSLKFKNKSLLLETFILILFFPYLILKLFLFIKKNKINLIFCHNFQTAILSWFLAIFYRKINFLYMHRIYKKKRFWDIFSYFLYFPFKILIGNSPSVVNSLFSYKKSDKIFLINNYVEEIKIHKNKYINFKNKNDNIQILTIGRLEKRKNIDFIIKVFNQIDIKNTSLLIAGDGSQKNMLNKLINQLGNKNIKLLGYRKDIGDLLLNTDIYVHASELEGLSNAVLEAMISGKPSVVLDSPGVSDFHQHNVTALIAKKDPLKFGNLLIQLINDAQLRKKLGLNAKKFSIENLNFNKTFGEYKKLYIKFSKFI